jgi:hydrogenase nickel incorporation protein HypA/HybF
MHELSIAMSIVDLATEEAERHGGSQVTAIHLKLGALSGVVKEALLSSFEIACEDTPIKGSALVIEEVPILAFCPKCEVPKTLSSIQYFCCPECSTPIRELIQGREIELVAMEIQDAV